MSQDQNKEKGNGEPPMNKNLGDNKKFETKKHFLREQNSTSCRICHSAISSEKLISPCLCKGSLAFVHLSCLERWLNQSGRDTCELCTFRFEAEQTRRYNIYQGLRIWYRHPRHLSALKADLVIGLVLTGVTLGLCCICVGGMKYFVLEGFRIGISYVWTEGVISFFLTVMIMGYFTTIYLMIRDHIVPWYQWWNRCVNVRLILDMDLIPAIDPGSVQINASTDSIMIPSQMSIISKLDPEKEEREKNQNTVIYIPDISSTSSNPQSVRTQPSSINQIPSVMSAIMSHIICNSIERSNLADKKVSKCNNDDFENRKITDDDLENMTASTASTVPKEPELPDPSSEMSHPLSRASSDII